MIQEYNKKKFQDLLDEIEILKEENKDLKKEIKNLKVVINNWKNEKDNK